VQLEGAHNVRELGGLPAGDRMIASAKLYRGDNIDGVTPADIDILTRGLAAHGCRPAQRW
jgi:protein-tyrosine phosphatase